MVVGNQQPIDKQRKTIAGQQFGRVRRDRTSRHRIDAKVFHPENESFERVFAGEKIAQSAVVVDAGQLVHRW